MKAADIPTREGRVAEAQRLRAEGYLQREIAARMASTRSTVNAWLSDPDGSKLKARKESYGGTCVHCGAATNGHNGIANAPTRCVQCAAKEDAIWTQETVCAAIRRFAERHGRPPAATDFNPSRARAGGDAWRARRFEVGGDYPHSRTVLVVFGTWNAAIHAAGFPVMRPGSYERTTSYTQRGAHLVADRKAA